MSFPHWLLTPLATKRHWKQGFNIWPMVAGMSWLGHHKGDLSFNHPFIHSRETTLMCSRNATMEDMLKVKEVLESGEFPTEAYITHEVPFVEMIENFEAWLKPETAVVKAMLSL